MRQRRGMPRQRLRRPGAEGVHHGVEAFEILFHEGQPFLFDVRLSAGLILIVTAERHYFMSPIDRFRDDFLGGFSIGRDHCNSCHFSHPFRRRCLPAQFVRYHFDVIKHISSSKM